MHSFLNLRLRSAGYIWALMLVLSSAACQVVIPPVPTSTAILPVDTPAPTSTREAITPTPNIPDAAAAELPTFVEASPQPSATLPTLSLGGPWLVLRHVSYHGEGARQVDLILMKQDGFTHTQIRVQDCTSEDQGPIEEISANRLVTLGGETYLINPQMMKAWSVYEPRYPCSAYAGNGAPEKLLAKIYQPADDSLPELQIYQLPLGKMLASIPLVQCSTAENTCAFDVQAWRTPSWDPSGRYLAFPVALDGSTSGLYVYDASGEETRQIARLEGSISDIWWSPDGTRIILGLSPFHGSPFVSSLWVVPLTGGEPRQLSALEEPFPQEIVAWLDADRFLICAGSLKHVVEEGADDLRLVDLRTGKVTTLFNDGFISAELDPVSETVGLVAAVYNSHTEDGYYLVPIANPSPRFLGESMSYQVNWNEDLSLFVTGDMCSEEEELYRAFDPQGVWTCASLPLPASVDVFPSPDEQWRAVSRNGLWVETGEQPPVQISDETPGMVIWQPDSTGFFFTANQSLYHVSVPDLIVVNLAIQLQDDDPAAYQWIGED